MQKKNLENELYNSVVAVNSGITKKDVRNLFVWYDLLSCVLPFQIIFITVYIVGSKFYPYTMFSVLFVFLMDSILKDSLIRDGKNYQKYSKYMSLVKLWVIPLMIMAFVTTISLVLVTFGMI